MEVVRLATTLLALALLSGPSALASEDTEKESLSYGCSGGFTGGGGGVVVHRDGEVYRWSLPTYRHAREQSFVHSDRAAARNLFAKLERINFTGIHYNKIGNMTCGVTLRREASTHVVAWPIGDPAAPSEVVALASRMEQIARAHPSEPK